LISQIDLIGSLAQLCSQKLPQNVASDTQNSLDAWLGKSNADRQFIAEQSIGTLSVIKDGWKYITPSKASGYYEEGKIELGHDTIPQLYNLSEDQAERRNVAGLYPEKMMELKTFLEALKSNASRNAGHRRAGINHR
jgi:hypothetical protein